MRTFKTRSSPIGVISPGEPFHIIEAGNDWSVNWYVVQERGLTLFGPSPRTLIDPISREEFVQVVREHARQWSVRINDAPARAPSQAYAILTMCRALYSSIHGEQVSKRRAALWTQEYAPQWAALIADALRWRKTWREEHVEAEASFPDTVRFVQYMVEQVGKSSPGEG